MTDPLEPNHQLRWALQDLPTPAKDAREVTAHVPALDAEAPEIAIVLSRTERRHANRLVPGWLYEGDVRVPARDESIEGGFPGIEAWLRAELGPYCLEIEVLDRRPGSARVRIFATSRAELDRLRS